MSHLPSDYSQFNESLRGLTSYFR